MLKAFSALNCYFHPDRRLPHQFHFLAVLLSPSSVLSSIIISPSAKKLMQKRRNDDDDAQPGYRKPSMSCLKQAKKAGEHEDGMQGGT
ncbi:hypothetical protein DL95DRAFT_386767 [Leptodontidium sp. 2 PMI_412]|nr:hypothetical protein DL95DRAFT_386767 [Leptodontidium sp. 2 PMI_412]